MEERDALVRQAVRRWSAQLVDLGGRNTLLYYRDLKVGTLDLATADDAARAALLSGRAVALSRLFPDPQAHVQSRTRARAIRNKARELREERGIETCYLAIGLATWTNPKGGATPSAPVLLRSAELRARGAAENDFELTLAPEVELNPTLVHLLASEFDVALDADELEDLAEGTDGFDAVPVFERLGKEAAERVRGFAVNHRQVLGTFSYAKLPMVIDLESAGAALAAHEVVAAMAGDRAAQARLRIAQSIDASAPDHLTPAAEFLVLDADSSQNKAINAVLAGQHAVVKGPPGTGKSQTIANLVTTLVAHGQRVLFVAEKRAAISAVTDRLARRGLGQLVMDVHDGTSSRRRIAADLKAAYDSAARITLPDLTAVHEAVVGRREKLNDYANALHEPRQPWGMSLFEARAALLAEPATTRARLRGSVLAALDAVTARQARELLREYAALGGLTLTRESSPWADAEVADGAQAHHAWVTADRLAAQVLPEARAHLAQVCRQSGLSEPGRLDDVRSLVALIDGVSGTLATFGPSAYDAPLAQLAAACAPTHWRRAHADWPGVRAAWWRRYRSRRQARALWRAGGRPGRAAVFDALVAAASQQRRWSEVSVDGSVPRIPQLWPAAQHALAVLDRSVAVLEGYLPNVDCAALSLNELAALVERLAADDRTPRKLPRLRELAGVLDHLGLRPLLDELRTDPEPDVGAMFDACWYASIVEHVEFSDARIGAFDGRLHGATAQEYRNADAAHIDATAVRVLRAVAEHIVAARDQYPDEDRLVEHQANLKRRHLPIRQLFAAAPHLLTALKPCWAMSPLVVSQLLPGDQPYFDVVIFDEASQVMPADAVSAILRAGQVVVAGDEHQLPPTTFFTAADSDSGGAIGLTAEGDIDLALTAGYESILDVLAALLPGHPLRWHYRSQDERLIAFSNGWIYDRTLVTFPGATGADRLTHVAVEQGAEAAEHSVTAEVDRVVQLILEHAAVRPRETLGVITMGIVHAERIDVALRKALAGRPDLHAFFAEGAAEPFFVKNLERVQGDERDAVVLSVGYGKNAAGKLLYRFGPLLSTGGERRLNVAVTRARRRMTIVSSFRASDMRPDRSAARGVQLLREYLRFAESGGAELGAAAVDKPSLNPFESDVLHRLSAAGIPVVAQYGVAGQFIEFAATHRSRTDASEPDMVLAIETDGPGYRAADTARDRDRLRQEHLQRLGWHFHRIWSTDWYADPRREVDRVRQAYDAAVLAVERTRDVQPALPDVGPDSDGGPPDAPVARRRTPRPPVPAGRPIADYRHAELVALIRWIESDTLLRTEEEVLDEVVCELGFSRRGSRIRLAVAGALDAARAEPS